MLPPLTCVCLNFNYFDIQSSNQYISLPSMRVLVTPAVYPRLFEFLTTLTFGALRKKHILSPIFEDIAKNTKKTTKPRRPRVVSNVS